MLRISDVMDGDIIIGVELTDGKDVWFFYVGHSHLPSLQTGKFPWKGSGEEFKRQLRIKYEDDHTIIFVDETMPLNPRPTKDSFNSPHQGVTSDGSQSYEQIGAEIGRLVTEKQAAYGDSFGKSGDVLRVLYPDGIKPEQYDDALAVVRIIDKLFRIANNRDAFGESPYKDIAGYGILGAGKDKFRQDEQAKQDKNNPENLVNPVQNPVTAQDEDVPWKDAHGF